MSAVSETSEVAVTADSWRSQESGEDVKKVCIDCELDLMQELMLFKYV
jgi:hypothetical protein